MPDMEWSKDYSGKPVIKTILEVFRHKLTMSTVCPNNRLQGHVVQ